MSLLLTLPLNLRVLVPLLLTLNIFHILHDVRYAKILKQKKESNTFDRLPTEVFFLPNINCPVLSSAEYNPLKFVLCPYIRTGRINGVLRYSIF